MLYILVVYEEIVHSSWSPMSYIHEERLRMKQGWNTYYMRCWLRLLWCSQSYCHTLNPSSWYILEASIIIIPCFQLSCPHELDQYLQFFYHISCNSFLVRTDDNLSSIVNCNKKQFMWWSPLEHSNGISVSCCFYIMFVIHQCCCYFFPEVGILFSSWLKQLVV